MQGLPAMQENQEKPIIVLLEQKEEEQKKEMKGEEKMPLVKRNIKRIKSSTKTKTTIPASVVEEKKIDKPNTKRTTTIKIKRKSN